jgi:hypothetical protein
MEGKSLEQLFAEKKKFESLLEHSGWVDLQEALQGQIRLRRMQLGSSPVASLDSAFQLAHVQGEIAGIQLGKALVESTLEDIRTDIQTLLEEERERNENGTRG